MRRLKGQNGFSLMEIIVVLIIMGVIAIVFSRTIIYSVQNYIFSRNTEQISQKAQLAMARLNIELRDVMAISTATADRIDYTLDRSAVPSCTVAAGCQFSIKRNGNTITLEGTNPVVAAQILIDGLNDNNSGNNFLSYYLSDGTTAWTTANGIDALAKIQVKISLKADSSLGATPLNYEGSINPRANLIFNAPQPN